mgnify:CR=1 FL=1
MKSMCVKTINIISKKELRDHMSRCDDLQIVNVLSHEYDHLGMIKGSKRIPLQELEERAGELDKSKEVVVYCASRKCDASKKAAEKLEDMGFDVCSYEGGIEEWKKAGYPMA